PRAPLPPGAHARARAFLPQRLLLRDVHHALRGWFGPALDGLGLDLEQGALARTRSWLQARRRLRQVAAAPDPAALLARLAASPAAAEALLCELFDPPRHGAALGRYPAALA